MRSNELSNVYLQNAMKPDLRLDQYIVTVLNVSNTDLLIC